MRAAGGRWASLLLLAARAWAMDAATHAERARQAWRAEDRDKALSEYGAALDTGGESAAYRHNRALIYLELHDEASARVEARKAVDLAPRDGNLRVTLAAAWMAGEEPDDQRARKLLKEAVRLLKFSRDHLGLGRAYYNLGLLARRSRDLEEARRNFALALSHDGSNEAARAALDLLAPPPAGSGN